MLDTLKRGSIAGAAGGAMMAMLAMITTAIAGDGFWAPVNAIAHAAWNDASLDGSFSPGALVVGMLIHMATAMMVGAAIAAMVSRIDRRTTKVMTATFAAVGVWLAQLVIWTSFDQAAADSVPQWALLVGHIVFGMTVGALLAVTPEHRHHRVGSPLATATT